MMSYYRDMFCMLSLLFCLFITSSSSMTKGLRECSPSSYSLKMESFNTLLKSAHTDKYESRPFAVGKYNWTLVVYPKGNKNDNGTGYISLYVTIDKSTLISPLKEVQADLRFYVFNKKKNKYFTIQDSDIWRFSKNKTMCGFSRVLPLIKFNNPKNGYIYDIDRCEFGVDVIIPSLSKKAEHFSVTKSFEYPTFTGIVYGFSVTKDYLSEEFEMGGVNWNLRVFPKGVGAQEGKSLSFYLCLSQQEQLKVKSYDKIYVRAKLRVPNYWSTYIVTMQLDNWLSPHRHCLGYDDFMPLSDLSSKEFVKLDMLVVQVEMEAVSSTKYFP